jgi:hypothetical protein
MHQVEEWTCFATVQMGDVDLRANHPSSSSLRDGAGRGAPGFVSVIGSLT